MKGKGWLFKLQSLAISSRGNNWTIPSLSLPTIILNSWLICRINNILYFLISFFFLFSSRFKLYFNIALCYDTNNNHNKNAIIWFILSLIVFNLYWYISVIVFLYVSSCTSFFCCCYFCCYQLFSKYWRAKELFWNVDKKMQSEYNFSNSLFKICWHSYLIRF